MTTNYHTDIATGASRNAAIVNSPLGELDAAITNLVGGASVTDQTLKDWVMGGALRFKPSTTPTRNSDGLVTSATVIWPDGSEGTYTGTADGTWKALSSFSVTHTDSGKTVTQPAVTREATYGYVTNQPALTVA
jgi:hypothetical protein